MPTRVLVAYGTTNGSTAQIAETVAGVLVEEGMTAQARPARSVTSVGPYDAVIVGGALYAGRWHRDARRFLLRHHRELAERPLWLFSSGPLDASASEWDIPPVPDVRHAMDRLTVTEHVTFGGCLEAGAKGPIARMLLRGGKGGDFRDVPAIEKWAAQIAAGLPPG
ncbi:flavodoxin domain-containing protein [Streptomyces sp. NPDC017958]|uniref:flavodoxin domain-containing protein n=1 Tax=Streptomyces sp. NPDC017958 TaxID=3365021 RepID=UPI0037960007